MTQHVNYEPSATVTDAVNTRRSLRAFLPEAVPKETIAQILTTAARATQRDKHATVEKLCPYRRESSEALRCLLCGL